MRLSFTTLALCVALMAADSAFAQPPGGGRGGRQPGFGGRGFGGGATAAVLLRNDAVRTELKITEEQGGELDTALEATRGGRGGRGGNREEFQNLSEEERAKRLEEMRAQAEEANKKVEAAVKKILKPEQQQRLDQIVLQQRGVLAALQTEEVQKKLELNEEQQEKVQAISSELTEEIGGLERGREMFQQMTELRNKASEKAEALLTAEQKGTWKEMVGKPFELPRRGDGGGRPGGGGGRPPVIID